MNIKQCETYICTGQLKKDFIDTDNILLIANVSYFNVSVPKSAIASKKINGFIESDILRFLNSASGKYCHLARQQLKQAQNDGFNFNNYELYKQFNLTLNQCNTLSFYTDNYTYTGGAHGTTIRCAQTFNTCSGNKINLCNLFKGAFKDRLINQIISLADKNMQENPGIYFDDYMQLITQTFNCQNFYLTQDGVVIYFGQYQIAPYSSGIIEFLLPYSFFDSPPNCN